MPEVTGKVTSINIKGHARGQGHLVFTAGDRAFQITLGYEPPVFTVMANLLVAAFNSGDEIRVWHETVLPEETPQPTEIQLGGFS